MARVRVKQERGQRLAEKWLELQASTPSSSTSSTRNNVVSQQELAAFHQWAFHQWLESPVVRRRVTPQMSSGDGDGDEKGGPPHRRRLGPSSWKQKEPTEEELLSRPSATSGVGLTDFADPNSLAVIREKGQRSRWFK